MHDGVINISSLTRDIVSTIEFASDEVISDERLVAAVLDGDETAFAEIFERYKRLVAKVVARFFSDRNEIEEFAQQSFTKAYFSLKNYRGGEERSFPAWISRITVNVCYDEFRRRQRKNETLFSTLSDDENDFIDKVSDGQSQRADDELISKQLAAKVLDMLEPKDRIAVTLVYSDEYSLSEAAEMIGISASNLKSRLFRCRNLIKKRLGSRSSN